MASTASIDALVWDVCVNVADRISVDDMDCLAKVNSSFKKNAGEDFWRYQMQRFYTQYGSYPHYSERKVEWAVETRQRRRCDEIFGYAPDNPNRFFYKDASLESIDHVHIPKVS